MLNSHQGRCGLKPVLVNLFVWGLVVCQAGAMEPNAFLRKAAATTNQLVTQVRADRIVMDRYVRHFAMSPKEILAFFSTLRRTQLSAKGTYFVYNCRAATGEIRVRAFTLKQGTPVWVDRSGKAVLKVSCGNPMSWQFAWNPEPVAAGEMPVPTVETSGDIVPSQRFVTELVNEPTDYVEPGQVMALLPELPDMTMGDFPETTRKDIVAFVLPTFPLGWLAPLGIIAFLPPSEGGEEHPPVPEPSAAVGCLLGLGFTAQRLHRRLRAKQVG